MTDIDPKALEHACQCAGRAVHHFDRMALDLPLRASIVAHARAIEQHEAFKREVSDVISELSSEYTRDLAITGSYYADKLKRFIIAKPDPLVEAWDEAWRELSDKQVKLETFRAALAARGLKIVEVGHD